MLSPYGKALCRQAQCLDKPARHYLVHRICADQLQAALKKCMVPMTMYGDLLTSHSRACRSDLSIMIQPYIFTGKSSPIQLHKTQEAT